MYIKNPDLFYQIKQKLNLITVMKDNGVKIDRYNKCLCFAHNEKTPSMSIKNNRYKCFGGCGASGDVFDFIQAQYGLDRLNAAKHLIDNYHLPIEIGKTEKDPVKLKQAKQEIKKRKQEQVETEQHKLYSQYAYRQIINYLHWLQEQERTELINNHIEWAHRQIDNSLDDKLIDYDIYARLTQMYKQHGVSEILENLPNDYFIGLVIAAEIGLRDGI